MRAIKAKIGILTVMLVLFSSIATALLSISPFPIYLGDVPRGTNITTNFNVTNTGSAAISSIAISSNAASKYNLKFNTTSISSISAGSKVTVAYNITVPSDEPASNHSLASLTVSASGLSNSTSFIANVKGRLKFLDVDVEVGGKGSPNLQDGSRITQEAKPRSSLKFNVDVENTFPNTDPEIEIEDIQVTVTIEDLDDGDDVEEESETFDLEPDRRKSLELRFEVPAKVTEDNYNVKILAEGTTDEGAEEKAEMTLTLEVEKSAHDILITNSKLEPTTVACAGSAKLDVTITNVGDEDERLAYILVESTKLKYTSHATEIELFSDPDDEENSATKNFTILVPKGIESGAYPIEARVYDDNNDARDYVKHILTVQECPLDKTQEQVQKPQEKQPITKEEKPEEALPIVREEQGTITELFADFKQSPLYLLSLGLVALIFVIVVVVIVIKLARK